MLNRLSKRLSLTAGGAKKQSIPDGASRASTSSKHEVAHPPPDVAAPSKLETTKPVQNGLDQAHKTDEKEETPVGVKESTPADGKLDEVSGGKMDPIEPAVQESANGRTPDKADGNPDVHIDGRPEGDLLLNAPADVAGPSSVNGTDGHTYVSPQTNFPPRWSAINAQDDHLSKAAPPTSSLTPANAPKRSSSGNLLARLLSVEWTVERQTITIGPTSARVDRQAHYAALNIRTFIVGPSALAARPPPRLSKSDVKKIRSSLLRPDEANRIIAHIRTLPSHPDHETLCTRAGKISLPAPPIHAACLSVTDREAETIHFCKLVAVNALQVPTTATAPSQPNRATKDGDGKLTHSLPTLSPMALSSALGSLSLVSLVTAPDLGFGHPASDPGIFSGAVPSAQEIGSGVEEVGRTLLALGFAGSGMVWPDHTTVYPPEDRMSCYTYWWGYELVLPHKSVDYLSKCKSISSTMLDFLTALALFTEGVREILPFVRYIAQFVDMEFDAVQEQDQGKGVVCAATWLIPVALVPRPWDFPPRPANLPGTAPVLKPILGAGAGQSATAPQMAANLLLSGEPAHPPVISDPNSPSIGVAGDPASTIKPVPNVAPTPVDVMPAPITINPAAAPLAVASLTLGSSAATPSAAAVLAGVASPT